MKHIDKESIYRVVAAQNLEAATKEGWRLVEILQETTPEAFYTQEMQPSVNGSFPMPMSVQKMVVTKRHVFLLRKDEGSALAEYEARATVAEAARLEAETSRDDALKRTAEAQKMQQANVETFQKEHARITEQLQSTTKTLAEYVEKASTFKDDMNERDQRIKEMSQQLAKLWAVLGQLQMERILGIDAINPGETGEPRKTVGHHLMAPEEDDEIPF